MKKFFALLLSLCLLSGVALAEGNTKISQNGGKSTATVSYEVEAAKLNKDFTVTIPSAISFSSGSNSTELNIKFNAESYQLDKGKKTAKFAVALTKSKNFKADDDCIHMDLENSNDSIKYYIYLGDNKKLKKPDPNKYIVTYEIGEGAHYEDPDKMRHVKLLDTEDITTKPAGTYTDTLTFTVSVTEE